MPVLRSSTRQAATEAIAKPLKRVKPDIPTSTSKRAKKSNIAKAEGSTELSDPKNLKSAKRKVKPVPEDDNLPRVLNPEPAPPPLPAVLSFPFEDAKNFLIKADPRFEDLFNKLECRPFQHLESVDPFRLISTELA